MHGLLVPLPPHDLLYPCLFMIRLFALCAAQRALIDMLKSGANLSPKGLLESG